MNEKHDDLTRTHLTPEELEAEGGAALPDKEAMSLITIGDVALSVGDIVLDVDAPINAAVYAPIDANVGVYAPIDAAVGIDADVNIPIDADLGIYAPINVYAPVNADVVANIAADLAADINADLNADVTAPVTAPVDLGLTTPEVGLPAVDDALPAVDGALPAVDDALSAVPGAVTPDGAISPQVEPVPGMPVDADAPATLPVEQVVGAAEPVVEAAAPVVGGVVDTVNDTVGGLLQTSQPLDAPEPVETAEPTIDTGLAEAEPDQPAP
jgi:hypothetical protein